MKNLQTNEQIIKLAKRLDKFSIEDIEAILGISKIEISKALGILLKESLIKQNKNLYMYMPPKSRKIDNEKCNKPLYNDSLFDDKKEIEIYNLQSEKVKAKIFKYIYLFRMTNGLVGEKLVNRLKEIGEQEEKYICSYNFFKTNRRKYLQFGIQGLIPNNAHKRNSTNFSHEIYVAFKELYLHPTRLSASECISIIKRGSNFKDLIFPCCNYFMQQLYKEYPKEKVLEIREGPFHLPTLEENINNTNEVICIKSKNKSICFDNYNDSIAHYLKSEEFTKLPALRKTNIKAYCNNHLNPFFNGLKFSQIDQSKINQFQQLKSKQGLSLTTISINLMFLSKLTNMYSINGKNFILNGRLKIGDYQIKNMLSFSQIKILLTCDSKINLIIQFILGLGLTQAELLAIEKSDIDFINQTITINKRFYNSKIQRYYCKYQRRILYIPGTLFNQLQNRHSGLIFKHTCKFIDDEIQTLGKNINITDLSYQDLIDAHVKICLNNNIQASIVSKDLGFENITIFLKRYECLFTQEGYHNFDPLVMEESDE